MKKIKIISILLIMVMAFTMMAGCDVITKNKERDLNQSVAEINYNGLKDAVTKAEVYEAYNSYGFYYTNYYGYTIEEAFDMIIDSLANRKLLLLYARNELAAAKGLEAGCEISKLLTDAEIDAAIKATNTTMQNWYDGIVKELEKEAEISKGKVEDENDEDKDETEKEEEETLKPRPVRPADAEPEFNPDAVIEKMTVKFFEDTHNESEFSEKAIKQLKKELADNYRSYDYYLFKQYETQVLQNFQRKLSAGYTPSETEITEKYNSYVTKNKEAFANDANASYSTSITNNLTTTVYHPVSGYGYVYNVLLKFSDEQIAMLTDMKKSGTVSETYIEQYRAQLAKQIKVNVSNLAYDPEYKCENCENKNCENAECPAKAYTEKDVDVNIILQRIFDSFNNIENNPDLNAYEKFMAKREEATKWVYMVNDDEGMYNKDKNFVITNNENGYLVTPEGQKSDYVTEFTELGRKMIKKGLGTFTTDGTVDGMYCVTDYGIHVMFVSNIPYDRNAVGINGEKVFPENAEDNGLLPLDYIVSYGRYGSEVTKSKTLRDIITENLISSNKNDVYTITSQSVIAKNKDNVNKKDKLIDKMIKEIKSK